MRCRRVKQRHRTLSGLVRDVMSSCKSDTFAPHKAQPACIYTTTNKNSATARWLPHTDAANRHSKRRHSKATTPIDAAGLHSSEKFLLKSAGAAARGRAGGGGALLTGSVGPAASGRPRPALLLLGAAAPPRPRCGCKPGEAVRLGMAECAIEWCE